MFDTHCHLDLAEFDEDRNEVIRRAESLGFSNFMIPGIEPATIGKIRALAEAFQEVYFASGIHPNNAAQLPPDWPDSVKRDAAHPKCRAIGEIGLDYYREYCTHDIQRCVLEKQLEIAAEMGLPVIIHCRNAYEDLWPILSAWITEKPGRKAVLHAFDEDAEKAQAAVSLGMMIGIGGTYTYRKKNERRVQILEAVPLGSILLETDCPYLSPVPHRGERNEPSFALFTLEKIAEIKKVSLEDADKITTRNALAFFNIKE